MPLYSLDGNKRLRLIAEKPIRLEADIQAVVETNLNQIFGLQLVAHEFTVQNFTLDTVAFDEETCAFVIIEYKRDEGGSVIDQGYAYLATMLNNKAEFVLKYNERFSKDLTKKDIDWAKSRVLFVAQRFTSHQMAAINFKHDSCKSSSSGLTGGSDSRFRGNDNPALHDSCLKIFR